MNIFFYKKKEGETMCKTKEAYIHINYKKDGMRKILLCVEVLDATLEDIRQYFTKDTWMAAIQKG